MKKKEKLKYVSFYMSSFVFECINCEMHKFLEMTEKHRKFANETKLGTIKKEEKKNQKLCILFSVFFFFWHCEQQQEFLHFGQ